jgi:hypothetical protein
MTRLWTRRSAFAGCGDGSSPSDNRAYAPFDFMHKNLASTSASRTALHAVRSTPQSRCACSSVNRRPGISRYSARIRLISVFFDIATSLGTIIGRNSTCLAVRAQPGASHQRRARFRNHVQNRGRRRDGRCRCRSRSPAVTTSLRGWLTLRLDQFSSSVISPSGIPHSSEPRLRPRRKSPRNVGGIDRRHPRRRFAQVTARGAGFITCAARSLGTGRDAERRCELAIALCPGG